MRAWLLTTCCSLLCLTGCQTVQPGGSAVSHGDTAPLSTREQAFSKALAHFGQGLLCQSEEGKASERALVQLQDAAELDPGNHDLHSRIAVIALHQKDPDTAIAALEKSYQHDPKSYQRCVDLAACYQAANQRERAIAKYREALKIDDSPEAVYIALAGLHFHSDADAEALKLLDRGKRRAETTALITAYTFEQAKRFVAHSSIPRAIPCFELLARWDASRRPQLYQLLAELYLTQRDVESAIEVLTLATRLPDALPEASVDLASILLQKGDREGGLEILEAANTRFENKPAVLFALGYAYSDAKAYERAIPFFERTSHLAIANSDGKKHPHELNEAFYLYYGAAYERTGQLDEAKRVFETGLRHHPMSDRMLNYIAYMLAEANRDLDQAEGYAQRAITIDPKNAAYLDTLGWIYFKQGHFDKALQQIEQANALMGPDSEILHHLGDIHSTLKDHNNAVSCWKRSYALDPSNETVSEKLRDLGFDLDAILLDTILESAEPNKDSTTP
ncbi:MAG: tetratricopeptide repeat protein [Verrucomicrobia bacterium]|jgi:tetratricopeptide (TPR) repeat protein|nr:tetratricopeptide repeat protein [Verrucomicrobiota bacterium]